MHVATDPPALPDPRRRLLDALAGCVASKGYALTTIADVAAGARVSKRTFYEHFNGKADALVALYEAASRQAMHALTDAIDPSQDWHGQAERAIAAYLATLASNPPLLRTLFVEILHLGPEGLRVRRQVNQAIADFIVGAVASHGGVAPGLPVMAMAIVGGINELILQAIEEDRVERLAALAPSASLLLRSVIDGAMAATAVRPAAA
jgi:AcrR family transcriptional regulator